MPFVAIDQLPQTNVDWLWRLAVGHLAIFDGDPGIGKSLVTIDLAARITAGRAFPDGTPGCEPANVILINAEDGVRDTVAGRLRAAGADFGRVHVFEREPNEPILKLPGQVHRLSAAIERTGARYVVIDPITAFLDASVNLANDKSVRSALAPLADLAARRRCVILLVRHLNKGTGVNALYRGLYSIGFIASCRVAWIAARDPNVSQQFVLASVKNNLDARPISLAYGIEPDASSFARIAWRGNSLCDENALMAGPANRLRRRMHGQDFLLAILKDGPLPTRDIWAQAKELGFTPSALDRARKGLKIRTVRTHAGTKNQKNYWLLPDQRLPVDADIDDLARSMEQAGEVLADFFPPMDPLD
jgi:AAA domain